MTHRAPEVRGMVGGVDAVVRRRYVGQPALADRQHGLAQARHKIQGPAASVSRHGHPVPPDFARGQSDRCGSTACKRKIGYLDRPGSAATVITDTDPTALQGVTERRRVRTACVARHTDVIGSRFQRASHAHDQLFAVVGHVGSG